MSDTFEIMLEDLKEGIQRDFLDFVRLETAEEGNYDIHPICVLPRPEED